MKPKANISEPRFQDDFVKAENDNLIETNQLTNPDDCKQNELPWQNDKTYLQLYKEKEKTVFLTMSRSGLDLIIHKSRIQDVEIFEDGQGSENSDVGQKQGDSKAQRTKEFALGKELTYVLMEKERRKVWGKTILLLGYSFGFFQNISIVYKSLLKLS